jgi:uncharacterized protein YacL
MDYASKRIRPWFTLLCVGLGGWGGNALTNWYFDPERYEVLSNLWQNKAASPSDKIWLRVFFMILGALLGFIFEYMAFQQAKMAKTRLERMAPQEKILLISGLVLGLLLTALVQTILAPPLWLNIAMAIILCYTSAVALGSLKEQMQFYYPGAISTSKPDISGKSRPKILDTNVIIDGRIADIARAGFVEGPIYVPKFVLEELQQIADSSDSLKRARGRRGLDILNQMQKEMDLTIPEFSGYDPNEEVDARLVRVAQEVDGPIVTNDYNLNRVAELQGVDVLNINELANAVKPVVLPGEEMRVTIIREGKEKEQGIGYLDDGTMIVVEGARKLIGETLPVCVTSVLQTVQGKMIFGKMKDGETGNELIEDSIRTYSGGRTRRKIR